MNLLITGAWMQAKDYIYRLEKEGHLICFLQYECDEMPCSYEWVEGIIGNGIFLSHPIERFINLKYIQLTSAGYDRVPMDYVNINRIVINNARGVYSIPMAEYAIWGVMNIYKHHAFFWDKQKMHCWEKKRDIRELHGQNICILGCGSVGSECAKRFAAFGCNIYGVDLVEKKQDGFLRVFGLDDIKDALKLADVVIITLPLTSDTYHMFNKNTIDMMKKGSIIVNISRGAVMELPALLEALSSKLGGAVLDVFEEEPLGEGAIWDMENVIITPHNSFVGDGNNDRMSKLILENLERYLNENFSCFTQK